MCIVDEDWLLCHNLAMKARDLKNRLKKLGWWLLKEGANHEIWTNGELQEQIPRHREIHELLARKILKTALAGKRSS